MNARSRSVPLIAALAALPSAARAADKDLWSRAQENRVGLELDLLSTSVSREYEGVSADVSRLGLGFAIIGQLHLTGRLYGDVEIPFAYGNVSTTFSAKAFGDVYREESQGRFLFGNPTLGAHYAAPLSKDLVVFAGGSLSIPTIDDPSREAEVAVLATQDARAFYDAHRMMPEHLPLRARAGGELKLSKALRYRADLGAMLALPTDGGDAELYVEQGNELELHFATGVTAGLRVQEVFTLTETDKAQTALEPFAGYETGKTGPYARLGLLVALDERLGFGLGAGKVATLRLAGGFRF